jgi:ABC-2 type transport system permease protein
VALVLEGVLCIVYMADRPALEGAFQKFLSVFYLNGRLENFFAGILDIGGIFYYLSVIVIFLVLTEQSILKRRWS